MRTVRRNFKFKGMRTTQDFIIYPITKNETKAKLQSDKRIAMIDLTTGRAILSKQCQNGAYFHHLSPVLGATMIDLTAQELEEVRAMAAEMSGMTRADGSFLIMG